MKGLGFITLIISIIIIVAVSFMLYGFVKISQLLGKSTQLEIEIISRTTKFDSALNALLYSDIYKMSFSEKDYLLSDYIKYTSTEPKSKFFTTGIGRFAYMSNSYVKRTRYRRVSWISFIFPDSVEDDVRDLIYSMTTALHYYTGLQYTIFGPSIWLRYIVYAVKSAPGAVVGQVIYDTLGITPKFYISNSTGTYLMDFMVYDKSPTKRFLNDALDAVFLQGWSGKCDPKIGECGIYHSCIASPFDLCYVTKISYPDEIPIPVISGREIYLIEVSE